MLVYWLLFVFFSLGALFSASRIAVATPGPVSGLAASQLSRRSIFLFAAAILLIITIGLRYRVGGDWANYADLYKRVALQELPAALVGERQEPGYVTLNWVAAQLGFGIWFVNLVSAVLFTFGLMQLVRQQPNPWLALVVATPFLIVVVAMGYTRQAVALGCIMCAMTRVIERKPVQFIAWIVAGAFFHRTALLFGPLMFVGSTQNRFLSYILVVFCAILAYFTVFQSTMDRYAIGYMKEEVSAAGATVRVIMDIIPAALCLMFSHRFFWTKEERYVWRTYAILCLISGAALPFIRSSAIIDRLAIYLIPIQMFVYGRIGYSFGMIRQGWLFWTTTVVVYSAAVMFVWLNFAANSFAWVPYRSYLQF